MNPPKCPGAVCWVHGDFLNQTFENQLGQARTGALHSNDVAVKLNQEGEEHNSTSLWARSLEARARDEQAALASSTAAQYKIWWSRYHEFLSKCGKEELLQTSEGTAAFLAHLAEEAKGLGGVDMAKAALSHQFKTGGLSGDKNPANSVQVDIVMRGIHRRFTQPPTKKTPTSRGQLEKVVREATDNLNWKSCKLVDFRLAAQVTFMFATAARYEEAREIKCNQLETQGGNLHILFQKGKCYQYGENRSSVIADRPDMEFNPKLLLEEYLSRLRESGQGEGNDYLFPNMSRKKSKEPASYPAVLKQFRYFLEKAGVTSDPGKFGLHSLRRGSVTTLANAGTSDHLIQKHMRVVTQDTVRRYATLDKTKMSEVSNTVFGSK